MEFAAKRIKHDGTFTSAELDAISAMHGGLVESLRLGLAVFLRGGDARRLVDRKALLRRQEAEAAAVSNGSAAESGVFLRIVRDLRRVHSHMAVLAYSVLKWAEAGGDGGSFRLDPPNRELLTAQAYRDMAPTTTACSAEPPAEANLDELPLSQVEKARKETSPKSVRP